MVVHRFIVKQRPLRFKRRAAIMVDEQKSDEESDGKIRTRAFNSSYPLLYALLCIFHYPCNVNRLTDGRYERLGAN